MASVEGGKKRRVVAVGKRTAVQELVQSTDRWSRLTSELLGLVLSYVKLRERALLGRTSKGWTHRYLLGYTLVVSTPSPLASVYHTIDVQGTRLRTLLPSPVTPTRTEIKRNVLDDIRESSTNTLVFSMAAARHQATFGYRTSTLAAFPHDRGRSVVLHGPDPVGRILYWPGADGVPYTLRESYGVLTLEQHERFREAQLTMLRSTHHVQVVMPLGDEGIDMKTEAPLLLRHHDLRHLDLDICLPRSIREKRDSKTTLHSLREERDARRTLDKWSWQKIANTITEPFQQLRSKLTVKHLRWLNLSNMQYLLEAAAGGEEEYAGLSELAKWIGNMPLLEYLDMGIGSYWTNGGEHQTGWFGRDLDVMSDMLVKCGSLRHFVCYGHVYEDRLDGAVREQYHQALKTRDKWLLTVLQHQPGWVTLVLPTLDTYDQLLNQTNLDRANTDAEAVDDQKGRAPLVVRAPLLGQHIPDTEGNGEEEYGSITDGILTEHLLARHGGTLESFTGGMILTRDQIPRSMWKTTPVTGPEPLSLPHLRSISLPGQQWVPAGDEPINRSIGRTGVFAGVRHLTVGIIRPDAKWLGLGMPLLEQLVVTDTLNTGDRNVWEPFYDQKHTKSVPALIRKGKEITDMDVVELYRTRYDQQSIILKILLPLKHLVWKNPHLKRLSLPLLTAGPNVRAVMWQTFARAIQLLAKLTPELTHLDLTSDIDGRTVEKVPRDPFYKDAVSLLMLLSELRHLQVVHLPFVQFPSDLERPSSSMERFHKQFRNRQFQRIIDELHYDDEDGKPRMWGVPPEMSQDLPSDWHPWPLQTFVEYVKRWSEQRQKSWKKKKLMARGSGPVLVLVPAWPSPSPADQKDEQEDEEEDEKDEKEDAPPLLKWRVVTFPLCIDATALRTFLFRFCDIRLIKEVRIESFDNAPGSFHDKKESARRLIKQYAHIVKDVNAARSKIEAERDKSPTTDKDKDTDEADARAPFNITVRLKNAASDGTWEWRPVQDAVDKGERATML